MTRRSASQRRGHGRRSGSTIAREREMLTEVPPEALRRSKPHGSLAPETALASELLSHRRNLNASATGVASNRSLVRCRPSWCQPGKSAYRRCSSLAPPGAPPPERDRVRRNTGAEMPPEIVSAPRELSRVQKSAKTKGYRPTGTRTRLPGYRRLPVLFRHCVKHVSSAQWTLRYRFVSARTRWSGCGRPKGRQPALSPHHRQERPDDGSADRSGQTGAR